MSIGLKLAIAGTMPDGICQLAMSKLAFANIPDTPKTRLNQSGIYISDAYIRRLEYTGYCRHDICQFLFCTK